MVHRLARRRLTLLLAAAVACGLPPPTLTKAGPDAAAAALRSARQTVDACLRLLDPAVDTDYARISIRCPGLAPALAGGPFAAWLPSDWNQADGDLTAAGLTQLGALLGRESARSTLRPAPSVAPIRAVLARLHSRAKPEGWWERLRRWLRGLAADSEQPGLSWWQRVFGGASLSQRALHLIVWSAIALLLGLAVSVILNELRVAGLLRRGSRLGAHAVGTVASRDMQDPDMVSPERRPALLLERIARRLAEQDRLPPARAFTARQLVRQARLTHAADRERLGRLAEVSELLRFSERHVPASRIAEAIGLGRELLASLDGLQQVDHA